MLLSKALRLHVSPEADVEEAVVLYFIIFHLFTNGDLRKLKILSPLRTNRPSDTSSGTNCLDYLCLPLRQPTRGQRLLPADTKMHISSQGPSWADARQAQVIKTVCAARSIRWAISS